MAKLDLRSGHYNAEGACALVDDALLPWILRVSSTWQVKRDGKTGPYFVQGVKDQEGRKTQVTVFLSRLVVVLVHCKTEEEREILMNDFKELYSRMLQLPRVRMRDNDKNNCLFDNLNTVRTDRSIDRRKERLGYETILPPTDAELNACMQAELEMLQEESRKAQELGSPMDILNKKYDEDGKEIV